MLAGLPLARTVQLMCRRGGTRTVDLVRALAALGFAVPAQLVKLRPVVSWPDAPALPDPCIVKLTWSGRSSGHWCLYYGGQFYDPSLGVRTPTQYAWLNKESGARITSFLPITMPA